METGAQESVVNRKILALVAVVLALILIAICYLGILLIRSRQTVQPARQQLAQTEIPLPTSVISAKPVGIFLPVVVKVETPKAVIVQTSNVWRFISIDANEIGTFENVGDPSKRLLAKCKDPNRPAPYAGELYTLYEQGILKPQGDSKKFQRFEVINR